MNVTPSATPPAGPAPSAKPPRGPGLLTIAVVLFIAVGALVGGIAMGPWAHAKLDEFAAANQAAASGDGGGQWYISQMHPWIIQPEPGQCPICGMDLTPVDPDRFAGEIAIDPVVVQNMGVRIAPATVQPIDRAIRTVGTVAVDETRVVDVVQRFDGWIEAVHVDAQWQVVQAGEPLFRIYSPAVFSAEEEYLIARRNAGSPAGDRLLEAARRRLELLALPAAEIERLEREGTAATSVTIASPVDGVVWTKGINQGSRIAPNTVVYRIADLSQVWIEATLYEHQLPFVEPGQAAELQVDYGAQRRFTGTIEQIYPAVDERTRSVQVRFVFPNRQERHGLALKPGMFVTVAIQARLDGEQITVPGEAVIGTGTRQVVFVSKGIGKFEPRNVQVGATGSDGRIAILDGIADGEQVVISGQFLLDSESKMRESLAKVMKGDLASEQLPAAENSGPLVELPGSPASWARLVDAYLTLQEGFYRENWTEAQLDELRAAAAAFPDAELQAAVQTMQGADLVALRPGFGSIGIVLDGALKRYGQPASQTAGLVGMHCSMADGVPEGGIWIQAGPDVRNPFFGVANDMAACAADSWGLPLAGGGTPAAEAAPALEPVPAPQSVAFTPTEAQLDPYFAAGSALYRNDLAAANAAGTYLLSVSMDTPLAEEAHALAKAADLDGARLALGEMGIVLRTVMEAGSTIPGLQLYRCGMARGMPDKGVWLQRAGERQNPFYGMDHGMRACARGRFDITIDGLKEIPR